MANFTLPSFPRSPRPTPPRDALAAAVAELKARLDAASVSFPRLSSAAGLHLVDSHADALALAASLADGDVVLVGGTSWYYVESHALAPFDPSGADARLAALEAKVPPAASPSNQLADKAYIATALAAIVGGAPEAYDTLKEIADWIADDESGAAKIVADVLALQTSKQNLIADLEAIRAGAAKGATAVQDVSGKRDRTDLSVGDGWLLVKPGGTQVWLEKSDPQQDVWIGDGFTLAYETTEAYWGLAKIDAGGDWVVDDSDDSPPDADKLEFLGSDSTLVYRLVRGSRLALDTEIPPVDDTVTRTSTNPVKSSGIWSAIWGALTALPTGFTAFYDWCVNQLAEKVSISGGIVHGLLESSEPLRQSFTGLGVNGMVGYYGGIHWGVRIGTGANIDFPVLLNKNGGEIVVPSATGTLALLPDIPDVSDKADAADLRYRIAEEVRTAKLLASAFPIEYTDSSATPTSRTITSADDVILAYAEQASNAIIAYDKNNPDYAGSFGFATFNATTGEFDSKDAPITSLSFNGSATATLDFAYLVADRTVNLITATDETSIDIELPAAVTVGAVRYARDFFLDIDNSANASDLALEFTGLGVDYAFVPLEDDSISEMMTIGAGERVRLYFTETPYIASTIPVINVARVTLGDFVTSTTPTTQGGN